MKNVNDLVYFNTDAEQSLLGEMLFKPENMDKVQLRSEHFYHHNNGKIFYFMKRVVNKGEELNIMTLADEMMSEFNEVGGLEYISGLTDTAFGKNVLGLERIITNLYVRRETVKLNRKLEKDIQEGVEPIVATNTFSKAFEALQEANNLEDEDDGHISKVLATIAAEADTDKGEFSGGITGFKDLDKLLNGVDPKSLTIIGARPSLGKTALAVNIGQNYANSYIDSLGEIGGPTLIFSQEMAGEKIGERMVSNEANINGQKMSNPQREFSDNQWLQMFNAMGKLSKAPIHMFDTPNVDINYVRRKSRMISERYPGQQLYIIIDYIQLMKIDPMYKADMNKGLGAIAEQLKALAKELGASIIALSQLSRGVEQKQDKRPMLSDLRDSGGLEACADVIMMLYRDDYYDKESENKGIMEVIVGKNRNGGTGTVNLLFKKEISKFLNIG